MDKWIFKYPIDPSISEFDISIPEGARFLSLQVQSGVPCIWMEVDKYAPMKTRHFVILVTGPGFISDGLTYLGTFQILSGEFVGHVYEEVSDG